MPLPVTEVERELRHTRRVRYEGYKRADGLWDIEAHLTDVKNHDFHAEDRRAPRRAADPRDVAAHHHRPPASPSSTAIASLRRGALSRRLRNHRAGLPAAGRAQSAQRISAENARRAARRHARLHAPDRDARRAADRGDPDLRRREAGGARATGASRSSSTSATRWRRPPRRCKQWYPKWYRGKAGMKIHEYQGKEIFRKFGMPTPRGIPGFHRRRGGRGGEEARRQGLGGEGADPRRRPRQGRRREGREVARRGARTCRSKSWACS